MTALENLYEEMMKRGCTKQQCSSKLVGIVLDIIVNNGASEYLNLAEARKELATVERSIQEKNSSLKYLQGEYSRHLAEYQTDLQRLDKEKREAEKQVEYIWSGLDALLQEVETPEAKDAIKLAKYFERHTDVDTKYDNTAFINGLAAILSGGRLKDGSS